MIIETNDQQKKINADFDLKISDLKEAQRRTDNIIMGIAKELGLIRSNKTTDAIVDDQATFKAETPHTKSDRNPLTDPIAGDKVRAGSGMVRTVRDIQPHSSGKKILATVTYLDRGQNTCSCQLKRWQEWAKGGRVLNVGQGNE